MKAPRRMMKAPHRVTHARVPDEDGADEDLIIDSPGFGGTQSRGVPYCRLAALVTVLSCTLTFAMLSGVGYSATPPTSYSHVNGASDTDGTAFSQQQLILEALDRISSQLADLRAPSPPASPPPSQSNSPPSPSPAPRVRQKFRVMSSGMYSAPIGTEDNVARVVSRMVRHAFPELDIEFGGCQMRNADLVLTGDNGANRCPDGATRPVANYVGFTNEPSASGHMIQGKTPLFRIAPGVPSPEIVVLPMLVTIIHDYSPPVRAHTQVNRPYIVAYLNSKCHPHRESMFHELRQRLPPDLVHGLGGCSHTSNRRPVPEPGKLAWFNDNFFQFYSDYEFVFAMENANPPLQGYITEKIMNAFRAGAVPIYWGDEETVSALFNPDAYINVHSFPSIADAADRVKHLHDHPDELHAMMQAPIFKEGVLDFNTPTGLVPFMTEFERGAQKLRDAYRSRFNLVG